MPVTPSPPPVTTIPVTTPEKPAPPLPPPAPVTEVLPPTASSTAPLPPAPDLDLTIFLDKHPLLLREPPFYLNRKTMIVLRALVNAAGGTLNWDKVYKSAIVKINHQRYAFIPDNPVVTVDDKKITLEIPPTNYATGLFVPITVWRDVFGGRVFFDTTAHRIVLSSLGANQ
jgi:hypothetical protein